MCGRFVSTSAPDAVATYFGAEQDVESLGANYNVAPTQDIYGVVARPDGTRAVEAFHWGLIPSWAKDRKIASKMINARSETAARLPAFRAAGVDRLSLGIQSFDDATLKRLGRTHRADAGRATVEAARAAGFANLSLDLIFGAPDQEPEAALRDVAEAHVLALETPEAAGQRFLITHEFLWLSEIADVLREAYPDRSSAIPSRQLPNWMGFFSFFGFASRSSLPDFDDVTSLVDMACFWMLRFWSFCFFLAGVEVPDEDDASSSQELKLSEQSELALPARRFKQCLKSRLGVSSYWVCVFTLFLSLTHMFLSERLQRRAPKGGRQAAFKSATYLRTSCEIS